MIEISFILSVALAHAATNLDNLAVMLALSPSVGRTRCVTAYLLTQLVYLGISGIAGAAAIHLLGSWIGYLGLIPIGLGLFALWQKDPSDAAAASMKSGSTGKLMTIFAGLGIDTLVVISLLLGDSSNGWRGLIYIGALTSLSFLALAFLWLSTSRKGAAILVQLTWLTPYVLIAVGVYILLDSPTDMI
ncbi:hypothetical protein KBY24_14535 [Ruegeria pomeroyi]|nr:hypothetical protein [Ruegeria pomeroyi]MCE8534607.1 hypothetical protein [Ruegeria pomeroyi]